MELFMFMCVVALIGGVVIHAHGEQQRRLEVFERFAAEYHGKLIGGRGFLDGQARVSLAYRGLPVYVEQTSTGGKHPVHYIEVSLKLERLNPCGHRIEVYPEAFLASLGKLLGMEDIEIGVEWFDQQYILKSNDTRVLKRFLDDETRGAIEALRGQFGNGDIYVHLDRSRLQVKKMRRVTEYNDVESVHALGLTIFDSALRTLDAERLLEGPREAAGVYMVPESAGIRFLPETGEAPALPGGPAMARPRVRSAPEAPGAGITLLPDREGIQFLGAEEEPPPEPTCPVCGENLEGRVLVSCRSCHTLHHHDCWEFNGACSTYGCCSELFEAG